MANSKTILSIEVYNKVYNVRYSGGVRPDWDHLSPKDRKTVLRHDGRILDTLIACPPLFERLAGFVETVKRYKRREAKKAAKKAAEQAAK